MITNTENIQSIIAGMEKAIKANTEYIAILANIKAAAEEYDGKVINKRFVDLINKHLPEGFRLYDYKQSYYATDYDFTIYQSNRNSENYSNNYRFPISSCFTVTDSGKHRVKASGFVEQCQAIRADLISKNIAIREEIDQVYQMLADAQALYEHAKQFENKYSFSLKDKFKCNYFLRTY